LRKQYKQIKEEYEKWLDKNAMTEDLIDLPPIQVKMPRDDAETKTGQNG